MARYVGNANIEVYFTIDADNDEQAHDLFYEALRRLNGNGFTKESSDVHYLGIEKSVQGAPSGHAA